MNKAVCLLLTPAITSSTFPTLLICRRQNWSAENWKWTASSSVMENVIAASKDCLWFSLFLSKQSACIMLSCYKSGTDTVISMQLVASVRRCFTSGSCGPKIMTKSKNLVGDISRIFWCRLAEKKGLVYRPQINNSCLVAQICKLTPSVTISH